MGAKPRLKARKVRFWTAIHTATQRQVAASNDALVLPDVAHWDGATEFDLILVCAGYDPLVAVSSAVGAFLARADAAGAVLGGLDTGTMVLAKLKLLSGYKAVLHHEAEAGFRETWPTIALSDQIYCLDRNRLTMAGGMATGDALLAWIGTRFPQKFVAQIAEAMIHGQIRTGRENQRAVETQDSTLLAMREIMLSNLSEPISISQVAQRLGKHQRHLARRCQLGLLCTPLAYYQMLRLQTAHDLLRSTELSISDISVAVGFNSLPGFSKSYRKKFGMAPSVSRETERQIRMHALDPS